MSQSKKEIDAAFQSLGDRVEILFQLIEYMPLDAPSTAALRYEDDDGTFEVNRKQLQQKKKDLLHEIRKDFPKLMKRISKSARKTNPEDFKGVYTPMVAAEPLRKFAQDVPLGTLEPGNPDAPSLIDQLPLLRQGYGLRNSFQLLWYISIYANNLQDEKDKNAIVPQESMIKAFDSVPSLYTYEFDEDGMVKRFLNKGHGTTFDMLEIKTKLSPEPFDKSRFRMWIISNILSLNLYDSEDLKSQSKEIYDYLKKEDVRAALLKEFQLLNTIKTQWKQINKEKS